MADTQITQLATGTTLHSGDWLVYVDTTDTSMASSGTDKKLSPAVLLAGLGVSVGLTVPSWLTVTGSPVTGSGTLGISAATGQTANEFLATPNGTTGAVGLRSIAVADLPANIPNANLQHSSITITPGPGLTGGGSVSLGGSLTPALALLTPTAVKTGAYAANPNDLVLCNVSAGSLTVTLPSAPANYTVVAVKLVTASSGTNSVTIAAGGSDVFDQPASGTTSKSLSVTNQCLTMEYYSGVWSIFAADNSGGGYTAGSGITITVTGGQRVITGTSAYAPLITVLTSSGNYTIPSWATRIQVAATGGGGSGGAGVATTSGTAASGGGGGSGGATIYGDYEASALITANGSNVISVSIGTGGASVTTGAGNAGTATTFGTFLTAQAGKAGGVGLTTGTSGAGGTPAGPFPGGAGAGCTLGGVGGAGGNNSVLGGGGGGAGGGVNSSANGQNGGIGANVFGVTLLTGGTAGTGGGTGGAGTNGGAGGSSVSNTVPGDSSGGAGGGGGGAGGTGNGGSGGAGGSPGGGGGGGGSCVSGSTPGPSGPGGAGLCVIIAT